jgi:hypothetical protein
MARRKGLLAQILDARKQAKKLEAQAEARRHRELIAEQRRQEAEAPAGGENRRKPRQRRPRPYNCVSRCRHNGSPSRQRPRPPRVRRPLQYVPESIEGGEM